MYGNFSPPLDNSRNIVKRNLCFFSLVFSRFNVFFNLKNKALYDVKLLEDRLDVIEEDIETATDDGDFEKIANLKTEKLKVEKDIETAENEAKKIFLYDIKSVLQQFNVIKCLIFKIYS